MAWQSLVVLAVLLLAGCAGPAADPTTGTTGASSSSGSTSSAPPGPPAFKTVELYNQTFQMAPAASPAAASVTVPAGAGTVRLMVEARSTGEQVWFIRQEPGTDGQPGFKPAVQLVAPSGAAITIGAIANGPNVGGGWSSSFSFADEAEAGTSTLTFSLVGSGVEVQVIVMAEA